MKKFLLVLFTLMISIGAWADVDIATATFDGKNATYTEGWTTTGTGVNRSDCIIIGAGENITSPEFDLTAYSSVTVAIKARRYGTLSDGKAVIDCAIAGSSVGTVEATSTTATNNAGSFTFNPTSSMDDAVLVFTCTNATSAGSTHGAGINTITITGVVATSDPYITPSVETINLTYSATSGSFTYTLGNEDESTPTAAEKVDVEWISNVAVDTDAKKVTFDVEPNTGAAREAVIVLTYAGDSHEITVSQAKFVKDFADLPLIVAPGTSSADLKTTDGVTGVFDGSDYSNTTHKVKFSKNTHYLQIKTNEAIGNCTFSIRGCAGAGSSTFTLSGSTNGTDWTEVETLTATFNAKDEVVELSSTQSFDPTYRYLKLSFKKLTGEVNCGLGAFTVNNTHPSFNLAVSAAEWSTVYVDFPFEVPAGLTVYTISAADETLTKEEVPGVVPAYTPLLVNGEEGTYTLNYSAETPATVGTNLLQGTLSESAIPADANSYFYGLSTGSNGVGFYWLKADGAAFTNGAHKAYLKLDKSASARTSFTFDGETAISTIESESEATTMFNLAGQRINEAKGLVIKNGKKIIVK